MGLKMDKTCKRLILFAIPLSQLFFSSISIAASHHHHEGMHGMLSMNDKMSIEGSGTSWQPSSSPMSGHHIPLSSGMLMVHGWINLIEDNQGGPRGGNKLFSNSMFMVMGYGDTSFGTFGFKGMVSLDPLMGKRGYPLLLQTGETADGVTPLIDRQHPHDFFMELAGTYSLTLSTNTSFYIYAGLPGEPALGPVTFMHRLSGVDFPDAPITHHWLDSTHVTFGVITLGYIWNNLKIEGSVFNGHEPDQFRWNIESPKLNSSSVRVTFNPNDNWSMQLSTGFLKSPEQLEPNVNVHRTTASITYNLAFGYNCNWQTTLAWGVNDRHPGPALNGYLLESAVSFLTHHTLVGRAEHLQNDELILEPSPLAGKTFDVNKVTLGYVYDFDPWFYFRAGLGATISTIFVPSALEALYDEHPLSFMLFARLMITQ